MTLPAELQVGRRAESRRRRRGEMDGCSRQDPAYRPAKGRAPRGGPSYLKRPAHLVTPAIGGSGRNSGLGWPGIAARRKEAAHARRLTATRRKKQSSRGRLLPPLPPADREEASATTGRRSRCAARTAACWSAPGRARPEPSAEPGARGSAAGVFAHEAKRAGRGADVSKDDVCQRDPRRRRERRRAARAAADGRLPAGGIGRRRACPASTDVFAAYGSWKRARRAAADRRLSLTPLVAPRQVECRADGSRCSSSCPFVVVGHRRDLHRLLRRPGRGARGVPHARGRVFTFSILAPLPGPRRGRAGRRDRRARRGGGRRRRAPQRAADGQRRGGQGALHRRTARAATRSTRSRRTGVTGPNLDELGGARPAARAERDRARRHGHGPHAGRAPPGRGRRGGRRLRLAGRRPVSPRRGRRAGRIPAAGERCKSPASSGLFRPGRRSAASMAASIEAEALSRKSGRGGPSWPLGRGRIAEVRVAQLFQREPVS